MKKYLW